VDQRALDSDRIRGPLTFAVVPVKAHDRARNTCSLPNRHDRMVMIPNNTKAKACQSESYLSIEPPLRHRRV